MRRRPSLIARLGGLGFPEIVEERAEHDVQRLLIVQPPAPARDDGRGRVDHHQRVDPDVPLGMPLRILGSRPARRAPGTGDAIAPVARARIRPPEGRDRGQELSDLVGDALLRKLREVARRPPST